MFGFISNFWKKRKVNRTQAVVLGDSDETLMCLPSDTAAWVVAKFNELRASNAAKDSEIEILRKRVLWLSHALDEVVDTVRPYVAELGVARQVFTIASKASKV